MVNPEKSMTKIHKTRLRKLIAFLRNLPRNKFSFGVVREETKCGTVGCAIGWTPEVFPELVSPPRNSESCLLFRGEARCFKGVASELFGMDFYMAEDLFSTGAQLLVHSGLPLCHCQATPKQVASMLEKFLALVDAGEIDFEKWRDAR